jgi:hypothetical protein
MPTARSTALSLDPGEPACGGEIRGATGLLAMAALAPDTSTIAYCGAHQPMPTP